MHRHVAGSVAVFGMALSLLVLVIAPSVSSASPPLTELRGRWLFDEAQGAIATDTSGNGNSATLSGTAGWAVGFSGGALALDGHGVAVVPYSLALEPNALTVEAWVKSSVVPTANEGIVGYGLGCSPSYVLVAGTGGFI